MDLIFIFFVFILYYFRKYFEPNYSHPFGFEKAMKVYFDFILTNIAPQNKESSSSYYKKIFARIYPIKLDPLYYYF
jgi:hypothetical protein